MQIIADIHHIDEQQWRLLAAESATASWFQTKEAYDFYASLPCLFRPYVVAVAREDASIPVIKGLCIVYITQEKKAIRQFLTRRAIIVGGPMLANDATMDEVRGLIQQVKHVASKKAIYIESRNFADFSPWKDAFIQIGFSYVPWLNFHIDTSNMEVVESHLSTNRKRDIRYALRDGAEEVEHPTLDQVRQWYDILHVLYATKVKTPLFPWEFFASLYHCPSAHFFLIQYNGEIIGGSLCMELEITEHNNAANKTCLYEWFVCGRDSEYRKLFPSTIGTYAGIRYAATHNIPLFDMMGAGKPTEAYGVRDFKARFGGHQVEHGRWLCITKPVLYKLGVIGVNALKQKR